MKICMAGACGRMGRRILELAVVNEEFEIAGAFDIAQMNNVELLVGSECGKPQVVIVSADASTEIAKADVMIDFTHSDSSVGNARIATDAGKSSVIGTTGLTEAQRLELSEMAKKVPIVFAPNMSIGVNLLFKLTSEVASILGLDYNVEIVEAHHSLKKDSPSGTAVRLAERAAEALGLDYNTDVAHGREGMIGERPQRQIGMHAIRGGDIVGEHTVSFVGKGERVELTHKAHNRDNFARGSLIAAEFCAQAKPGLYDMQDVLGLR